jgi:hypothetical protein
MRLQWTDWIFDNFAYKLVALAIALILWVTLLGKGDFVVTRTVDVEVEVPFPYQVNSINVEQLKMKLSGPKSALRKLTESGAAQMVSVEFKPDGEGVFDVEVPKKRVDLPFGVKVLSIRPAFIQVRVEKKSTK